MILLLIKNKVYYLIKEHKVNLIYMSVKINRYSQFINEEFFKKIFKPF